MHYNDKAYFTRESEYIITDWHDITSYQIVQPNASAFLSIEVTISESGTLAINGLSPAGVTITENISFDESGIKLSNNEFKSILALTPSWSTYNITIKAEDKQGQPVQASTAYGPFPISVANLSSQSQRDNVNVPGWEKGQWLICYIQSFQPQTNDKVVTTRGWSGFVQDIVPAPHINFPVGWQFFLNISQ